MTMLDTPPFLDLPSTSPQAKKVAKIGNVLLALGSLTQENIDQVLRLQKVQRVRFGIAAQHLGLLTAEEVDQALAQQFHFVGLAPGQGELAPELFAAYAPFSLAADVVRGIRSQLLAQGYAQQGKTIAIVGIDEDEGNSLLVANLAVMFSQINKKTLLIDANLRAERQQTIFKTTSGHGLADVLAHRAGIETIKPVDLFPGLFLLAAGTIAPNPAELLGRGAFRELHFALLQKFDVILIDTCGFSVNGEAVALAGQIDGAIVSARAGHTRCCEIALTAERLAQAGVAVIGSVLLDY
jgi:chain length determinant protein tyrosine kinase EpsG